MSEFSLDVLQRRVFPFVEAQDPDILLGAGLRRRRRADAGCVTEGTGVHVMRGAQTVRYTKIRCEEDELARMRVLHPRSR